MSSLLRADTTLEELVSAVLAHMHTARELGHIPLAGSSDLLGAVASRVGADSIVLVLADALEALVASLDDGVGAVSAAPEAAGALALLLPGWGEDVRLHIIPAFSVTLHGEHLYRPCGSVLVHSMMPQARSRGDEFEYSSVGCRRQEAGSHVEAVGPLLRVVVFGVVVASSCLLNSLGSWHLDLNLNMLVLCCLSHLWHHNVDMLLSRSHDSSCHRWA